MTILIENRQRKIKINMPQLRLSANKIMQELHCQDNELSVLLVDNHTIQDLNRRFLDRDYPTNVLAFSQSEGEFSHINPHIMGDVVISVEQALIDSWEGAISFEEELDYLLIHGILHLLSFDHENVPETMSNHMVKKTEDLFYLLRGYRLPVNDM